MIHELDNFPVAISGFKWFSVVVSYWLLYHSHEVSIVSNFMENQVAIDSVTSTKYWYTGDINKLRCHITHFRLSSKPENGSVDLSGYLSL